ncbi:MAG: hypothetical protein WAK17_10265 [Candidatus Nitrosopolaris sp.]|jgi:hypothetical protein
MAEETERAEIKKETREPEEEQNEIENERFQPGIKEPQKEVSVDDQQLNVLPENEEEKAKQLSR